MAHIEDFVMRLACEGQWMFNPHIATISGSDWKMVVSFSSTILNNKLLTERQKKACVIICKKYKDTLSKEFNTDAGLILDQNLWRTPTRKVSNEKSITIALDKNGYPYIAVNFPYDPKIIELFREYKQNNKGTDIGAIVWNDTHWHFELTESNIKFLLETDPICYYRVDDEIREYYQKIKEIELNLEDYIPMIDFDDNEKLIYRNASAKIPAIDTEDLFKAFFQARQYGINCWSDKINEKLSELNLPELTLAFLKTDYSSKIIPKKKDFDLSQIDQLIKSCRQVLFVIPAGSESAIVSNILNYLNSVGYKNDEMSVLFRLETKFDSSGFNFFIKNHNLNNSLSERTKFIFISQKYPKPLIEYDSKIDLVLTYGTANAHYTLQNMIKHHHSVIIMNKQTQMRGWKYVEL